MAVAAVPTWRGMVMGVDRTVAAVLVVAVTLVILVAVGLVVVDVGDFAEVMVRSMYVGWNMSVAVLMGNKGMKCVDLAEKADVPGLGNDLGGCRGEADEKQSRHEDLEMFRCHSLSESTGCVAISVNRNASCLSLRKEM